ncbi:DUF4226 domain-containing protein [Mycolicibacterium peregrinum]|uniref:Biofilm regulator BssS n=1 Tax=Mycolicibacterium peregrinum TaxID=43304 RepID=A0A1A0W902_MYCPR|nr:DUF4226 domain-containing protein [Mycolicibacterium peregrinum]OBB92899.1 hypothetical protein A5779_21285 [Mycolicibacterium peregrinum]
MTEWSLISDVVSRVVGGVTLGPAGAIFNPIGMGVKGIEGMLGGGDHPAERTYAGGGGRFGGGEPNAAPAAGQAPPAPAEQPEPPNTEQNSGAAATAASADAAELDKLMKQLAELDKKAAATVDAVHASGEASKQALQDVARDVDAKIKELGPRLNTGEGQQELRDYLKERLSSAKQVIEKQIADAEAKARETQELANRYAEIGGGGEGTGEGGNGGGNGGAGSGGTPVETTPASTPSAVPAGNQAPTGASPFGSGMMPAGMPMSMPSLPSFGGGGMPGMGGFGDPLSALSGLGGNPAGGETPQLQDQQTGAGDDGKAASDGVQLHDNQSDHGGSGSDDHGGSDGKSESGDGQDQGTHPAGDQGAAGGDHAAGGGAGAHTPGGSGTQVEYVDDKGNEVKTDARTEQAAAAVRAHMNGASVAESYADQKIDLPPPGSPITDPKMMVPPNMLKAGDVGVFKDHLVMALGNNKVYVSGQVQPLDSISSGPDFLAWIDPTAGAQNGGHAPATAPANPNVT